MEDVHAQSIAAQAEYAERRAELVRLLAPEVDRLVCAFEQAVLQRAGDMHTEYAVELTAERQRRGELERQLREMQRRDGV